MDQLVVWEEVEVEAGEEDPSSTMTVVVGVVVVDPKQSGR